MQATARLSSNARTLPFRARYREEMNCQIVHDSIHRRPGWTLTYLLQVGGRDVGFGSIAVAGPWTDKPTLLEFYVLPEHRTRAFDLFEAMLELAAPRFMETQSNDLLLSAMFHAYARDVASEKIVFRDHATITLEAPGATLRCVTSDEVTRRHIDQRQGGPEWRLEVDGQLAGNGGILFHYNRPYGDLYMEVSEPFRRRGLGAFVVQELKRYAYELGAIPCARCSPTNVASRRTLQKGGFIPFAHMLTGVIAPAAARRGEC
jgi:GNAT superfamily N-acetyltransferase